MAQMDLLDRNLPSYNTTLESRLIPTPSSVSTQSGSNETYEFTLTLSDATFATYKNFRFTWYYGDGQYSEYLQSFSAGGAVVVRDTHTYFCHVNGLSNPDEDVYVEVTGGEYDDLDPPEIARFGSHGSPMVAFSNSLPTSPCNFVRNPNVPSSLAVTTNRNLVADHHVTYILSVANKCEEGGVNVDLFFRFNNKHLTPEFPGKPSIPILVTGSNTPVSPLYTDEYQWTINNLEYGEVRNVFVRMKVADGLSKGDPVPTEVDIDFQRSLCSANNGAGPIVLAGIIDNSHDPNNLTSDINNVCVGEQGTKLRYTIRFRNDGNGPADEVTIKTIIPDVFELPSLKVIYPDHLNSGAIEYPQTILHGGTREAKWVLKEQFLKNYTQLKGTQQNGFGTQFYADATVDSLVFDVDFIEDFDPQKCAAIINQAELIFDCNPSFFTGPNIYSFNCDSTFIDSAGDDTTICIPCIETIDYTTETDTFFTNPTGVTMNKYDATVLPTGALHEWFPRRGLTNYKSSTPDASPQKATEYFLVARNNDCERTILRYPVVIPCDLEIVPVVTCDFFGRKCVDASVTGTYQSGNLKWNSCDFSDTYSSSWLSMDEIYLTVVDTSNNCFTDITVDLNRCDRNNWTPVYLGAVAVAFLAFLFLRRRP